jgi:hypothetical protein
MWKVHTSYELHCCEESRQKRGWPRDPRLLLLGEERPYPTGSSGRGPRAIVFNHTACSVPPSLGARFRKRFLKTRPSPSLSEAKSLLSVFDLLHKI